MNLVDLPSVAQGMPVSYLFYGCRMDGVPQAQAHHPVEYIISGYQPVVALQLAPPDQKWLSLAQTAPNAVRAAGCFG